MAIVEESYIIDGSKIRKSKEITNIGILTFLENIACKHSDTAGYGYSDIEKTHLSWVLLHWKLEVFKRPVYGDKIIIKTWARKVNRFFTLRDFEMYDENNTLLCQASSKWSLINADTGSLLRLTDDIIAVYNPEGKSVFNEEDIEKLKEPEHSDNSDFTFSVLRRDIDYNNHMHNLYYLDYAYESLPKEVYESEEKNHLEIMYRFGVKLNEVVNCYYSSIDGTDFVVMKNNENNKLSAIIKLY